MDLKISYALELLPGAGQLAPFAEIGFADATARRIRAGAAIDLSAPASPRALALQAYGQRTTAPGSAPGYVLGLGGSLEY